MKRFLKSVVEKTCNVRMYSNDGLPRGLSVGRDIAIRLPSTPVETVFDVGANIGQSSDMFLEWFSGARIYCFEPSPGAYEQLQDRLGSHPRVRCFACALGASPGTVTISVNEDNLQGKIGGTYPDEVESEEGFTVHSVEVRTVDEVLDDHSIVRVNLLKIDAGGHDLEVLRGAAAALDENRIDVVQVEAGMSPETDVIVSFESLKSFLEGKGYRLFGIYDQVKDWFGGRECLRRVNAVFISREVIAENGFEGISR